MIAVLGTAMQVFSSFGESTWKDLEDFNAMVSKTASVADVGAVPWWLILVEGILGLIFGIFFITAPGGTSVFAVTVLGFYFLVRGIIAIIQIFLPDRVTPWGWLLFLGILGILAGLAVLRHPLYATVLVGTTLIIFIACFALIMGFIGVVMAFVGAGWGSGILGALSIVIAVILFANVVGATLALPIVIGVFMIIGSIGAIFFSFRVRSA